MGEVIAWCVLVFAAVLGAVGLVCVVFLLLEMARSGFTDLLGRIAARNVSVLSNRTSAAGRQVCTVCFRDRSTGVTYLSRWDAATVYCSHDWVSEDAKRPSERLRIHLNKRGDKLIREAIASDKARQDRDELWGGDE